jgi:2-polyprenyl-3-methyl-5-hydroxy-6-metoxy-1,4-benzoquinol methylase
LIWTASPNQFLVSEVGSLAPGKALDLGCGEGRNAVWLAEQGWEVTAVDFSDVGVAKGREMATKNGVDVAWLVSDLNDYVPQPRAYDLVIDFYVHLAPDQRRALSIKAASAVAPGGILLIVGHDLTNLADGYGGPQDLALLHSPETIAPTLTGLTVVKAERVTRVVENEAGRFEAIDSLVRAEAPDHH